MIEPTFQSGAAAIWQGDLLAILPTLPEHSIDLVFGSPPYEDARTYGIDFRLKGQDWVDWMVEVVKASLRVCKGLVAFVVEGRTRGFRWSATPVLLMADLHRAGICLRKPPAFARVGIPGSGGPDWLRNDYEFIVCATNGSKLPWSDNTAMGHPPKYGPGGAMSHRLSSGVRVNAWGAVGGPRGGSGRKANGEHKESNLRHPTRKNQDGIRGEKRGTAPRYDGVAIANPGNIIRCVVGGGAIGSEYASENEAPFPEALAEFFVRSFCPPGGIVCDPFGGSGTVAAVAVKTGRDFITIDLRESQVELIGRRVEEARQSLLAPRVQAPALEGAGTLFVAEQQETNR